MSHAWARRHPALRDRQSDGPAIGPISGGEFFPSFEFSPQGGRTNAQDGGSAGLVLVNHFQHGLDVIVLDLGQGSVG